MFSHIIFDFDGTLADSRELFMSLYNELASRKNYPQLNRDDWERLRSMSILERCRTMGVPIYRIPFIAGEFLSLYRENLHELKICEGVREMLSELKQTGKTLAIISSNSVENISKFLASEGIEEIDAIISSGGIFSKAKTIKAYLRKHGLTPDQVLYVGDELRDIEACRKLNVPIAWVEWGYDPWEAVEKAIPTYRIGSFGALTETILQA